MNALTTKLKEMRDFGGALRTQSRHEADHLAKAIQNSGAADLLRPYRRVI